MCMCMCMGMCMRPLTSHIDGGVCARCRTTAGAIAVRRCELPRAAAGAPPAGRSARQRECDAWRSRCEEVHTESTSAADQRTVAADLFVDECVEATSGSVTQKVEPLPTVLSTPTWP